VRGGPDGPFLGFCFPRSLLLGEERLLALGFLDGAVVRPPLGFNL
jgi:hypothetical protein